MSKWIDFGLLQHSKSGKTLIWDVYTKESGDVIGQIRWNGPWRKYCFYPWEMTVFEEQCLRDIADFCEFSSKRHKASASSNGALAKIAATPLK